MRAMSQNVYKDCEDKVENILREKKKKSNISVCLPPTQIQNMQFRPTDNPPKKNKKEVFIVTHELLLLGKILMGTHWK